MAHLFQSNVCSVCLAHYTEDNHPVVLTGCGHIFCHPCVQQLVTTANSSDDSLVCCPIDRQPFAMTDVRRIYNTEEGKTPRDNFQDLIDDLTRLELENNEFESNNRIRNRLVNALQTENQELNQQREAQEQIVVGNLFWEVTFDTIQKELNEKDKKHKEDGAKKNEKFGRLQQRAKGLRKQVAYKTEVVGRLSRDLNQQREFNERACACV